MNNGVFDHLIPIKPVLGALSVSYRTAVFTIILHLLLPGDHITRIYVIVKCKINKLLYLNRCVTLSSKRYLIAKQTVSSQISCFHTFWTVFFINTAKGETQMFSLDAHERHIS